MITEHTQGLPYVFTPLPWEAIAATGANMQKQLDTNQANMDAFGELKAQQKYLTEVLAYNQDRTNVGLQSYMKDKQIVDDYYNALDAKVNELSKKYASNPLDPKLRYEISAMQRQIKQDLTSGPLAQVSANYASEMERRKQWEKEGSVWSQESGKVHDFMLAGNRFLETGQGLQNAPIGKYTDRIKIMGDVLSKVPETLLGKTLGPNGTGYILNIMEDGVGMGRDEGRLQTAINSVIFGNTEMRESVELETRQKLYQQGLTGNEIVGKTEKGKPITSYQAEQAKTVQGLMNYGWTFAHKDRSQSMSTDPYYYHNWAQKQKNQTMPIQRNIDYNNFNNDKEVENISNRFKGYSDYISNQKASSKLTPAQQKQITSYYWTMDIVGDLADGKSISGEKEIELIRIAKQYNINPSGMDSYRLASAIASKKMDEIKGLEKTTGYKAVNSEDYRKSASDIAEYKEDNQVLWNKYKKQYGDTPKATELFLDEIKKTTIGRVAGTTTSIEAADATIGKAETENTLYDIQGQAMYLINPETGRYDKNSPVTINTKDLDVAKVSVVQWDPTSQSASVKITTKDNQQYMVDQTSFNQGTQKVLSTLGHANNINLRKDDKSYQPVNLGGGQYLLKQTNGTYIVGYPVVKDGQISIKNGKIEWDTNNSILYDDIQDLNYDYNQKFAVSINPQKIGYKKKGGVEIQAPIE